MSVELPPALTASLDGAHLVQASAGTGKTWTLSWLYARLVVEQGLPANGVLMVTFTRAATAELRDRVRRRLAEVLAALDAGAGDDELMAAFIARLPDPALARRRLEAALTGFDDAAIHTIHSFCQRALADRAFSGRLPFDTELAPDPSETLNEVVGDFWRRQLSVAEAPPPYPLDAATQAHFAGWLVMRGESPASLRAWVGQWLARQGLEFRSPPVPADLDRLLAERDRLYPQLQAAWRDQAGAVEELLRKDPGLKRQSYNKNVITKAIAAMGRYLAAPAPSLALPDNFDRLTTTRLAAADLTGRHPFTDLADQFLAAHTALVDGFERRWAALRGELLAIVGRELPERLAARGLQSWNDLLTRLAAALDGPDGEPLAASLRTRYPAALIDEFQDTDPLQWSIFRRIYLAAGGAAGRLFLVGDPKQAIYSFRGADLYAYLDAAREVSADLKLAENQRSVAPLVGALNRLFGLNEQPFLLPQLDYPPVHAAPRPRDPLVEAGEADAAPLRFILAPAGTGGKPLNKGDAVEWSAAAVADEVARLLAAAAAGEVRLGDSPLRARDMAVLVAGRYHGGAVRQALAARGVAAAELTRDSVFASTEAEDLGRFLAAVAQPQRTGLVKAALLTDLMGLPAWRLADFEVDDAAWEAEVADFLAWHALWRRHGFMRMLRQALAERGALARLAASPKGERRLTNLIHLAELVHAAEAGSRGPAALARWLQARRAEEGAAEEAQLRLESDENLVQIVTIHAAKGLEYPVVFLPGLWDGGSKVKPAQGLLYHGDGGRLTLELLAGKDSEAEDLARMEERAERLRLAYVALTRAKNRCHVCWGGIKEADNSPLGWLLHGSEPGVGLGQAAVGKVIADLVERSGGDVQVLAAAAGQAPAAPVTEAQLACRIPARPLARPWRVASFTSLKASAHEDWRVERPDHDQAAASAAPPAPGGGRWSFPGGAAAGDCLHQMLERMDYADPAGWEAPVRAALRGAGHPAAWSGEVRAWLGEVLALPLGGAAGELRLADLPRERTLREMEFHLPLAGVDPARIAACAREHGLPVADLRGDELAGFLKGYVDLIFVHDGRFYLADWKSNRLGDDFAAYGRAGLAEAMAASGYHLQYLLYTLALHRWLRGRLPDYDYEAHFGGAYYLFLRGMQPGEADQDGSPRGVYHGRPPLALVEALDRMLAGEAP